MKIYNRFIAAVLFLSFVLFAPLNRISAADEKIFDLVITNGRVVDGTGNPWFYADVAVKNGRIVKVGKINPNEATETIDAQNKIVAPGFIDVHTHVENIFDLPEAENFVRMGVTSLITGNCGGSETDVKAFLGRYKTTPLAVNVGTLIGHNSVRAKVLGLDNRQPTAEEQAKMEQLVGQAMRDGAVGFSTGLIYLPGVYSKTDEVIGLAKAAAKYNGIYASHIRDEGTHVVEAIGEAINIGEQAKMPVEISHFKISSKKLWGESPQTIGLVKAARARGLQVTVDEYVYTASSTSLDARMPSWAIAGGRDEGRKRLADPENHKKVVADMKKELEKKDFKDYSFAYVASYSANPEFNGKNIAEITQISQGKNDLDSQIEQILEMYGKGGAGMVYRVMSETDVQNILHEPFTMFASDSGVRRFGEGAPHPRGYGNNARVLGEYVRNLKLISLEDAIRKMTSLPAQTFSLRDRGQIREGFAADIVIFDENTVGDLATFDKPHQYATGFTKVIVSGETVFDGEKMTGKMSGQPLYGNGLEKQLEER